MKPRISGAVFLIIGMALCIYGLWQLLSPDQYRAVVHIKLLPDIVDIAGLSADHSSAEKESDQYYKAELTLIYSDAVMKRAAVSLDFKASKEQPPNGLSDSTAQIFRFLKHHMTLRRVANTTLAEIQIVHTNPTEAARFANAVAQAYIDQKHFEQHERNMRGIEALKDRLKEEETKIQQLQEHMNTLPPAPDQATSELLETIRFRDALARKIAQETNDMAGLIHDNIVELIDTAKPPTSPSGPHRTLGGIAFLLGLGLSIIGLRQLFLKSSAIG